MAPSRLLVVDDDPDILLYVTSLLEDNGYEVGTARSAAEALAALDASRPDAMLVDVLMPGRSGLDLLVSLRRSPVWSETPLVVMTGMDQILRDDCQNYLGNQNGVRGPDAVLGKPIDPATLLAVLGHLLPSRTSPAESPDISP
jgi:twitching motility two-component system response regulator PilH